MFRKLILGLPAPLQSAIHLMRSTATQHISAHAAGICLFLLLALFPMSILTCAVLGAVGLTPASLLSALQPLIPYALLPMASQLVEGFFAARSIGTLSATVLLALWSASRGIYGIMLGLNAVCRFDDHRGFVKRRIICMVYLFLMVLGLPLALIAHMMGYTILLRTGVLFTLLRHLGAFVFLSLLLSGIYVLFPAKRMQPRVCFIGGACSTLTWQLFTAAFSLYAQNAESYSTFYGSLRFIALGLLWLYFCMIILLFGGAISAELHNRLFGPNSKL